MKHTHTSKVWALVTLALLASVLTACSFIQEQILPRTPAPDAAAEPTVQAGVTPVSEEAVEGSELVGVVWQWRETLGNDDSLLTVPDPASYTLEFLPDGMVAVKADCNQAGGDYTVVESSLAITITTTTLAACPPESLSDAYLSQLNAAGTYIMDQGNLIINLIADAGNMKFVPGSVPAAEQPAAGEQPQAGVETPTAAVAPQVTLDAQGLAQDVQSMVISATPYDNSQPPGPTGAPTHTVVLLDGQETVRVWPADEYIALWQDAGDETIALTVEQLRRLLKDKPKNPKTPLPILPPPGAVNDLALKTFYLSAADGPGMRFIGRVSQDASPVLNGQLNYYYLGLTKDGKYIISVQHPVTTFALPDSVDGLSPEEAKQAENNFEAYLKDVRDKLTLLKPGDFTPNLKTLDTMVQSIAIAESVSVAPPIAPTQPGTAIPLTTTVPVTASTVTSTTVPTAADYVGVYKALRPAADSPGQYLILRLTEDGKVEFITDFLNKQPAIREGGAWEINADGNLAITVTGQEERVYATPLTIVFQPSEDGLIAVEYDQSVFGSGGIKLQRIKRPDSIAETTKRAFLTLDLDAGFALDPLFFSVNGGGDVNSSLLGDECSGFIYPQPVVSVDWTGEADFVKAFFYSDHDTTLVVQTPDGKYLCNDDVNAQLLDPEIQIEKPAPGRYNIWVGSYAPDQVVPGVLVLTAKPDVNIGSFALGSLIKRGQIPQELAAPKARLAAGLLTEALKGYRGKVAALKAGQGAASTELTTEGTVAAFDIPVPEGLVCNGFINERPDYVFEWSGETPSLRVFFEGEGRRNPGRDHARWSGALQR